MFLGFTGVWKQVKMVVAVVMKCHEGMQRKAMKVLKLKSK